MAAAMMLGRRVGFNTPSIVVENDNEDDSSGDEIGEKEAAKLLDKALTYTRKSSKRTEQSNIEMIGVDAGSCTKELCINLLTNTLHE
ncbi:hypothetical protein PoB_000829900 [Plakobranchus ocellatus]|uniref:Uncharacterized protein n=1 Tax=Plakobranchus ocellatus TaxID=259542 RepID=A0AAV3YFN2_9GAST|nr:hypothetical protein PoB_000829900 [Plakobranchus ocellatus]